MTPLIKFKYRKLLIALVSGGMFISAICASVLHAAAVTPEQIVQTTDVVKYYLTPNQKSILSIYTETDGPVQYSLLDYYGREVKQGQADSVNKIITLELNLEPGFYQLVINGNKDRFIGILAIKPYLNEPDKFFCMDIGTSWLFPDSDPAKRIGVVKALKQQGIFTVRERLGWDAVNPESGKWDWEVYPCNYDSMRNLYETMQMSALDLYHTAPAWASMCEYGQRAYPVDMNATKESFQKITQRWGKVQSGWDIWNEPDLSFGGSLPPDQYMRLVKTISYAAKDSNIQLVGLSSAEEYLSGFHENAARNGLLNMVDAISFHSYASALMFERSVENYREYLRRNQAEGLPLWITECGFSWNGGATGEMRQYELRKSAMHTALKAFEAKACGVAQYYPFIFASYAEGTFSFSMLGRDNSPLHLAAAYFTVVNLLAGHEYVGDLAAVPEGILRSRVFAAGNEAVVALCNGDSELKKTYDLKWSGRLADIDGKTIAAGNGETITINSGITYLITTLDQLKLNQDTAAMKLSNYARNGKLPQRLANAGLVVAPMPDLDKMYRHSNSAYYYTIEGAEDIELFVHINNLQPSDESVKLSAVLYDGDNNVLKTIPLDGTQVVPAGGSSSVKVNFNLAEQFAAGHESVFLHLTAVGGKISDRMIMEYRLQEFEEARAAAIGAKATEYNFASQRRWFSMGPLWQWQSDLDTSFCVNWAEDKLLITVKVWDNELSQDFFPEKMWTGDSLQLAIQKLDVDNKAIPEQTTQIASAIKNNGEVMLYPDRKLSEMTLEQLGRYISSQITYDPAQKLTVYQITIQPEAIGLDAFKKGMKLGFSLLVNDNDGEGRKGCMVWGDGIATYNGDTKTYNNLVLE